MTESSRRLHPLSFVFLILGSLKGLLFPAAFVLFTARGSSWDVWALWFSIPAAVYALFRYFTTRYAFADDELVIRTGLFFKNERHIRYSRIQNIETIQNPLHRALGVAEVRVETGGGTEQEARLRVLSLEAVDVMRRRVFEGKRRGADAPDEASVPTNTPVEAPRVLVRLGLRDLAIFGLVQNRGGLVVAAALGVLWEANILDTNVAGSSNIRRLVRYAIDAGWFHDRGVAVIATLVGIFLAFLLVVRVLSIGWAIVRLYDFTLTRSGDELRTTCGLITKVHAVIPLRRVQLVTMRQAPLQRAFDRVELRVQTAGGDKDATPSREWLAPMLRRDVVDALLADVIPGPGFDAMEWRPVDARAAQRELRMYLRLLAVPALIAAWVAPVVTFVAVLVLATLAVFAARGRARSFGYALAGDRVACRGGWLWRSASLARFAKVQVVTIGESPFDRRWKMANVGADTAGGGAHRIAIPYLAAAEARAVFEELGARVNPTAFRW